MRTLITLTLAALVVAGTIYAFGRARVERAVHTFNSRVTWSPSEIVGDKAQYMRSVAADQESALSKVEALILDNDQRHSRLAHELEERKADYNTGRQTLRELTMLQADVEATGKQQAEWHGQSRSREWLRQALDSIDQQTSTVAESIASLEHERQKSERVRTTLAQTRTRVGISIQKSKSSAAVREAEEELRRVQQELRDLSVPSLGEANSEPEPGPPTLEELREAKDGPVSDERIRDIMRRYGPGSAPEAVQ